MSYYYNTNGFGKTLSYNQLWSVSEDSRVVISLRGSFVHVCYVVLNQGCCRTCQYNLLDRMLQHDFNTTLNQGYVILIALVSMTYHSRGSVSPTYPSLGQWSMKSVICPIVFNFFFRQQFLTFPFSACNNKKYFYACLPDQFF